MNDVTFNILKIVLSIACALIAAYLVPLLKEKLKDAKYKNIIDAVKTAVEAAEQTFKEAGMGKVKKEEVIKFVTNWMIEQKFFITEEQLDQLIEAAVYQLNKGRDEK